MTCRSPRERMTRSPARSRTGSCPARFSQHEPESTRWNLATLAPSTSNPHGSRSSDRQYTVLRTRSVPSSSVTASWGAVFSRCMDKPFRTPGQASCPFEHSQRHTAGAIIHTARLRALRRMMTRSLADQSRTGWRADALDLGFAGPDRWRFHAYVPDYLPRWRRPARVTGGPGPDDGRLWRLGRQRGRPHGRPGRAARRFEDRIGGGRE